MSTPPYWKETIPTIAERLPIVERLSKEARRGLVRGLLLGALLFLLLGGLLGGFNRGSQGAVIGALSGGLCGAVLGGAIGAVWGRRRLRQAQANVLTIELSTHGGHYAPGEPVSGFLVITAGETIRSCKGQVCLVCRGFYTHDKLVDDSPKAEFLRESREYVLQGNDVFVTKVIRAGATQRYPFSITIPADGLPTYHGYVCTVRWALHAIVEGANGVLMRAHRELFVEADPLILPTPVEGYQSMVTAPMCQMTLMMPRVVYAEGETLQARVQIMPLEELHMSEVHALLLRIEHTATGDDHTLYVTSYDVESGLFRGERHRSGKGTTYVWLEGEAHLSGPARLDAVKPVEHSFTLNIPIQWRPTLATPDGQVTWKLGVVMVCDGYADTRVFHEVIVHTGAPMDTVAPAMYRA